MAAIRMLFSYLTEKGILGMNPAREVQTPRFSRVVGKTSAPPTEKVQQLLDGIDVTTVIGLRDRTLLGVMAYTFARIGPVAFRSQLCLLLQSPSTQRSPCRREWFLVLVRVIQN